MFRLARDHQPVTSAELRRVGISARRLSLLACATGALCLTASAAMADNLTVQGSTTFTARLWEPHQAEVEKKTGHKLAIIPNQSVNGLTELLAGRTDIAMISAPLVREVDVIRKKHPDFAFKELQSFEIARVRVGFVVNPQNKVRQIKLEDLRKILLGQIVNWSTLGGPDLTIRPVLVGEGGGVTATVQATLLDKQPITADAIRVRIQQQVLKIVEQEPGAIGISQVGLIQDSRLPEVKTDEPLEQILSLVTFGAPTAAEKSVIDALRGVANDKLY